MVPEPTRNDEPTYQVRALERGLQVLGDLAAGSQPASLQDLHQRLGFNKATLLRLVDVLQRQGFIESDPESGRYRLGIRAFEVGNAYLANAPLEQIAQPYLQKLSEQTAQTANLGVLAGNEVVHLASVAPDRPLRFQTRTGFRDQLHATGLGKVLAAHLAPEAQEVLLRQAPFPARTSHTITEADALRAQFALIQANRFAEDREENTAGLVCLAAPVRDARGQVVAALSISGLAHEFTDASRPALLDALWATTAAVSRRLGASSQ